MKSIIKQIHNGELYPDENIAPGTKEYNAITKQVTEKLDGWKEKLSNDDFKELETVFDLEIQSGSMEIENAFISGFELASLLMIEVFTKADDKS